MSVLRKMFAGPAAFSVLRDASPIHTAVDISPGRGLRLSIHVCRASHATVASMPIQPRERVAPPIF
jgi:hypothetical protein